LFHSFLDEKYFPLKFSNEKSLSELLMIYNNTIEQAEKCFEYIRLNTLKENFEFSILQHIHALMVVYRRNKPWNGETEKNEKENLIDSITKLLTLVSKETLLKCDVKIDEGDWGRERMTTLERAVETSNPALVKQVLEKGHVTHLGMLINTGNWDFPCGGEHYPIFDMSQLSGSDDNSKVLINLIAQFDTCNDLKKLAECLSEKKPAKKFLLDIENEKNKLRLRIDDETNKVFPITLVDIIVGYAGVRLFENPDAKPEAIPKPITDSEAVTHESRCSIL